ncbi:AbiH family protein [Flavobacterium limicola]|uniref:AbiH family protein n=1 Tax=Flavobacterium limicola TaxID=180441 RepID=UPI001ABFF1E1|nr:AbiH family protein [Flavobacterium limicola]
MRKGFLFMGKILITGNGFDLFHHLPTKYGHFMSIMKTIEDNNFSKDISFEDLFGLEFKIDSKYDYNAIIDNYNVENILFNHEKLNGIKEMLKDNLWYKYFSKILEIDTWIDFEVEVENVLKQFEIFNKHKDKRIIKKNAFDDYLFDYTDFKLFQIINDKMVGQIPFTLNEKYINKRSNSIDIRKMLDDLAKSFEDFIKIFNRYLIDVVSVFYPEIIQKPLIPFQLMDEIYTFNYTPTLQQIYKVDKSKVVYLHGEINDDCDKQNIVLGISEMPKTIETNKVIDFTKYYQKIIKNSNKKFIQIPSKNQAYSEETFFYIIGHSLDNSDKEYVLDLFEFLKQDTLNKSRICVFYYDDKDRDSKIRNLLNVVEEKLISKMNREDRLSFVKLNETNLELEFNKILYKHYVW